jgi:hypothetical protein
MEWQKEDVQWAFRIFNKLLQTGTIDETERDYHYAYQRSEVRQIIEEVIEQEAEVKIFSTAGNLYLTPGVDNRYFGYTNAELREKMKLRNNSELYLAYFIILCLLAKFYNSEDQSLAARQFVPVEELEETVTNQVEIVLAADEADVAVQEENYQLNLRSVAETWQDIPAFDDKVKNLKSARNNRVSFILRVMRFLEEEGQVQVLEEREVRLLPKMEHLVVKYYFHSQRKDYLLQLLAQPLPLTTAPSSGKANGKELDQHATD